MSKNMVGDSSAELEGNKYIFTAFYLIRQIPHFDIAFYLTTRTNGLQYL